MGYSYLQHIIEKPADLGTNACGECLEKGMKNSRSGSDFTFLVKSLRGRWPYNHSIYRKYGFVRI